MCATVAVKECPILMSAPMVRALLNGTKTQTRRIVKKWYFCSGNEGINLAFSGLVASEVAPGFWRLSSRGEGGAWNERAGAICPYGKPGERLWVKETFYAYGFWTKVFNAEAGKDQWHFNDKTIENRVEYRYADNAPMKSALRTRKSLQLGWYKRPAIFMPRDASRITLEVAEDRVQRLQEISEEDAIAEGIVSRDGFSPYRYTHRQDGLENGPIEHFELAAEAYRKLWESINETGSWDANPWVWAVTFKVAQL